MLLAAGLWASYRLVNVPAVADFLIAVEAEMNKVSWPTPIGIVPRLDRGADHDVRPGVSSWRIRRFLEAVCYGGLGIL